MNGRGKAFYPTGYSLARRKSVHRRKGDTPSKSGLKKRRTRAVKKGKKMEERPALEFGKKKKIIFD